MGQGRTTGVSTASRLGGVAYVGNNNFNLVPVIEDGFLPSTRYSLATANSKFHTPKEDDRFGVTNIALNNRDYRIGSIYLTHQIGNLYLEMASNHSFNERLSYQHVYAGTGINEDIDINRTQSDGSLNPMFLEPYTEGHFRIGKVEPSNNTTLNFGYTWKYNERFTFDFDF
ncbi:MAG: hypothetical protein ABIR80_00115, partial [Opitutaceae bacterium]